MAIGSGRSIMPIKRQDLRIADYCRRAELSASNPHGVYERQRTLSRVALSPFMNAGAKLGRQYNADNQGEIHMIDAALRKTGKSIILSTSPGLHERSMVLCRVSATYDSSQQHQRFPLKRIHKPHGLVTRSAFSVMVWVLLFHCKYTMPFSHVG